MIRALEHICVAVLAGATFGRWIRSRRERRLVRKQIAKYLHCIGSIESRTGSKDVLDWKDVNEAPPASMDVSRLAPGEATSYTDARGSIYRFKIADGTLVNMYYTKAGVRRSGDLHDCTQYDVVLKGRTRLRILDPATGKEFVKDYKQNDFIVIPARTPHMFEFLEDNCLLEWWSDDFRAWYYKPYRTVIEQALPLEATKNADFSTCVEEQERHLRQRRHARSGAAAAP